MKTFVKENWYKLMIGCSMFIFSISALIYSVAPAYANVSKPIPAVTPVSNYDFYLFNPNNLKVYGHVPGQDAINSWEFTGVRFN
jgi:hypothetical protein